MKLPSDIKLIEDEGQVEAQPHLELPQWRLHPLSSLFDLSSLAQQLFFSDFASKISFLQESFPEPQAIALIGIKKMPNTTNNMK